MKKKILLMTAITMIGWSTATVAQTISCSNFSITGVDPDTLDPNTVQIRIYFNAAPDEFVNYPYIASLLDCNGDTIATGGMYWFGQFGQTTQDYPVTLSGTLECEPYTAEFIYITGLGETDTCYLTFGTTGIFSQGIRKQSFSVYPNPAQNILKVKVPDRLIGSNYILYDYSGKVVLSGRLHSVNNVVELGMVSRGIYYFICGDAMREGCKVIKQ